MKTIDRYIIKELLKSFFTVFIAFVLLFLIFDFAVHAGKFFSKGIPSREIFLYYMFMIPSLTANGMPMVLLLALFWSMNRLNRNHEIAALQASGMSPTRICTPLFIFSALLAVANFQIDEQINTKTARKINRFMDKVSGHRTTDLIEKQYFYTDTNDSRLYFQKFDPKTAKMGPKVENARPGEIKDIPIVWDARGPGGEEVMKILAVSGEYVGDSWWLYDLNVTRSTGGRSISYKRRRMYEWAFSPS